ncbi:3-keto-disaccharide hydrolase [Flavilitoribacter nigricans]|uniref:3-keto-alpha-glucoside-1,2-lyase/3-keto-2-hydroxy-glucal hydratase domain-containing protein n=1 Tax=Flavilitoribacter nigricans (strain ATCC 23147 / DSM 23189 / NBRC 102662 / NCIMB 1420 / SS-2) TaxID=1122177 RepID=A0A2D0N741_FLAN2|nr:DUF1080 domain-containing protein [Flavilitoribacter nigricans]PHN04206.1 hypothetical protein CRP01_21830 [Flavilitoribacter nigricans DSM 23189 = NBRC 102662]
MIRKIILAWGVVFLIAGCKSTEQTTSADWQVLFNGTDLSGWDTYLNRPDLTQPQGETNQPIGLNNDPQKVFSVVREEGAPAIRISGQTFGGISTQAEFDNYHLQLTFKWGKQKWPPREQAKMDSGVLYHAVGPHGAANGSWMRSQELQVQQGDCGDYWGVSGAIFDIPARMNADSNYVYAPGAPLVTFKDRTPVGRHCIKQPDAEKSTGEWNVIDLYCSGDTAIHVINGQVNMILYNSRQLDGETERPLTKGKIEIQSEGAEIFYRDIRLRGIAGLPTEFLKND